MRKKIFTDLSKESKKHIELQDDDKNLLSFLARNKYIDGAAAKIVLNKKNDRAFLRRIKKLIEYEYIRKKRITINFAKWGVKQEFITALSLDDAGADIYNIKKIKTVGVQGEHLRHNLFVRRVCANIERLKQEGFEYETEQVLDDYNDERIYIDKTKKYKIRPDIFMQDFAILIEVELNIKPDRMHYGKRLFWTQYLRNYNKTVWLVNGQKDKEKLIKIFTNYAGESFKYDPVLDKKMIFTDTVNKNLVVVFDDFFASPETFLKLWAGLN